MTALMPAPENAGNSTADTVPTNEPGSRVGSALGWSYLLSIGRFAIGGTLTFVLAAILDPRAIGVMFMAMVWISFVLMLVHNATLPLLQQDGIGEDHFSAAFWAMLIAAVGVAGLMVAGAPLLAALNRTPELTGIARALAPLIVLEAITAVPDALLRRRLRFRSLAVRSLIAVVVGGCVGIALAAAGFGVWALVGQQLANAGTYVLTLFVLRPWTPRLGPMGAHLREMRATAATSVAGFLGWFIAKRTDALLMGVLLGPVAVGLYRLATRLTEMVVDLTSSALNQVSLPDLASHFRSPADFAERLRRYLHANAVLAFPLLGIVAASAAPLLAALGPEWTDAAYAVRVLCVASGVGIVTTLLGTALLAAQRPGAEALSNWGQAAVSGLAIGGGAYATRHESVQVQILAIALAVLTAETIMAGVLWHITFRRVLRAPGRRILLAILPATTAGIAADAGGWAVLRMGGDRLPALAQVTVAFVTGATAAGAVLLATDATARALLGNLLDRSAVTRALSRDPKLSRVPALSRDPAQSGVGRHRRARSAPPREPFGDPVVEPMVDATPGPVPVLLPVASGDNAMPGRRPDGREP